jgi:prepilin-type N-terminal cleavage/methylation domain-containing protein
MLPVHTKYQIQNSGYRSGFTLIELLMVIGIIAILTVLATYSYNNVQRKARDSVRKQNLNTIKNVLHLYFEDNDTYPPNTNGGTNTVTNRSLATILASYLIPNYIDSIPLDPKNDGTEYNSYHYDNYCTPQPCYRLYVWLENNNDPQRSGYTEAGRQIYWIFSPGATIGP